MPKIVHQVEIIDYSQEIIVAIKSIARKLSRIDAKLTNSQRHQNTDGIVPPSYGADEDPLLSLRKIQVVKLLSGPSSIKKKIFAILQTQMIAIYT